MLRRLLGVSIAGALLASVPACGGSEKPTKIAKTKKKKTEKRELLAQARDEAKAGEIEAADELYEKAYAVDKELEILEEHIDFLLNAGKPTRAAEVAKVYYDGNATDLAGYRLYTAALLAGNKGAEALEVADQMIGIDDEDPYGHERRGRALLLLEKDQEAIQSLRRAVQLDPKNAVFHKSLGTALHKIGEVNEAALEFRAALKFADEDAEAHVLLGMALRDQNELDESRQFLEKALDLDPRNGRAFFELGLLLNRQGKQAEAEDALAKAVKYQPNESLYWYAYGEIYRLQQRFDEALNAYQKAVELDPPYPKAIGKLGLLLVQLKKYDDAEAFLIQGIRKDKTNAVNYLHLGSVYAAKRKYKLAIENFEEFLERAPRNDPDRDRARDAIRELKRKGG